MKKIKWIFGLLFLAIVIMIASSYHSGIDLDVLRAKYSYPESKFIPFEGMDIHYRKTGEGPTIFLMHGVSSSLHTWEVWQRELSKKYTVVSIDIPSFGLTGAHPKDDYSIEMYMRAIDHICTTLNIDSMIIGGNSYGGYLAWNYALHQPERVKKLILVNAAGFKIEKFDDIGFKLMSNPKTSFISARFTPKFIVKKSVENVYGDPSKVTDELVQRYYELLLGKGTREGFSKILQQNNTVESKEDLISKVTQPTLIIWGDKDHLIDVSHAYKFQKAIKNSQLKVYESVGHTPMEEIPMESVALVETFLAE